MIKPTIAFTSLCVIFTVIFGSAMASFADEQADVQKLNRLSTIIANTPCDEKRFVVLGEAYMRKAVIWESYRYYGKAADEMIRFTGCAYKYDREIYRTFIKKRNRYLVLERNKQISNNGNQYNQSIIQGGKDGAASMTVPPDCGKLSTYDYNRYCK
jgi:hypothetical protein